MTDQTTLALALSRFNANYVETATATQALADLDDAAEMMHRRMRLGLDYTDAQQQTAAARALYRLATEREQRLPLGARKAAIRAITAAEIAAAKAEVA